MKRFKWTVLAILIILIATAGTWVYLVKFEREKPTVQILPDKKYLGQKISVTVEDQKSGVAEVQIEVVQQGKSTSLLSEKFPKETRRVERTFTLRPLPQGLKDGEASIKISAKDHSWNGGNPVSLEKNVIIDTIPPQLSVLGIQHYVNQGGTGLVTYVTNKEVPVNGVQVGDVFFPGFATGKDRYLSYFAIPPDAASDISTSAMVEDYSGNQAKAGFRVILKRKAFKKDKIQLSDDFLKNIIPYFTSRDPNLKGTPLEIFLAINRKQRELDHKEIKKVCQNTAAQPLWSGTFLRLPNAKPMASFAQDRTYYYNGQEVDRQVHLGVDLASLAQSPVPAANSGKVVFAGPLGIYGSTVMIDHGCGLFSMYSHLSKIETEVNKEVKKGDRLALTGSTGMAGGDHLHFAMLVHGVFVNPIEWWDEHWIKDNIELKMKSPDSPQPQPSKPPERTAKAKSSRKAKKPSR
jgi:murein DD-endopeptidase MepM/ murein hydrolase activator NlpD